MFDHRIDSCSLILEVVPFSVAIRACVWPGRHAAHRARAECQPLERPRSGGLSLTRPPHPYHVEQLYFAPKGTIAKFFPVVTFNRHSNLNQGGKKLGFFSHDLDLRTKAIASAATQWKSKQESNFLHQPSRPCSGHHHHLWQTNQFAGAGCGREWIVTTSPAVIPFIFDQHSE